MRNPAKWIVAAAVAGLAASGGGSALTASNTMPAGAIAGYGEVTVSGAVVVSVTDTLEGTDGTNLASVVFDSTTNLTGDTMTMTLKLNGNVAGSPYACSITTPWGGGHTFVTCVTADNPALATFDAIGLSVSK